MNKALIIGGGPAGCATAHQLSTLDNWDITLVERSEFLGAGVRTHYFGGHPYTFGPRHFLTTNEKVFEYLNDIVPLRDCGDHQFISYVEEDNDFYNFPIHMDDIRKMPDSNKILEEISLSSDVKNANNLEDYWISSVGKTLYNKIVNTYNKKMWLLDDNKKIDTFNWSPKGVTIKDGPREAWDNAISAYPYAKDGYNFFFDSIIDKVNVHKQTNIQKFNIEKKEVVINNVTHKYDVIINTISPDVLFDFCYGELPYIGRDLHKIVFPGESIFPEHVYFLYYPNDEKFTRLVEYNKFTLHKSKTTLIGIEYPSLNGKYYPLPIKSKMKLADMYYDLMPQGVFSIGRAGSYRYLVDIDDCIEQAMEIKNIITSGVTTMHPVPLERWRKYQ